MPSPRVVVTGMGVLTALGDGVPAFTEQLRQGSCGIRSDDELTLAARIPDVGFADRLAALNLPPSMAKRAARSASRATRTVQWTLLAALEAWREAQPDYAAEDFHLVVAGHNFGLGNQFRTAETFRKHPEYVPARYAIQFLDTDHIGVLSEVLGIRGEGFTVGGASASGNMALLQALHRLRSGQWKACMVAAPPVDLSPVEAQALRHTGAIAGNRYADTPERAGRPFDAERDGFVFGEGCACVILETDTARVGRGVVAGGATNLDGHRSAAPSEDGEVRVMENALVDAGVSAEDIDYINTHGTGSQLGDEVEANAIRRVFGGRPWINATKGLTGHAIFAAGLIEAVAVLVQLSEGFLHPNRNLETPIEPELRFVGSSRADTSCRVALSNAFGFGGINTAVVFEKAGAFDKGAD